MSLTQIPTKSIEANSHARSRAWPKANSRSWIQLAVLGCFLLFGILSFNSTSHPLQAGDNTSVPSDNVKPVPEHPDFRRHVMPLISKLGCNAAACHGNSEGQGGFKLSLFGFELAQDHQALVTGDPDLRANWNEPLESLVLTKPTLIEDHEGGKLFQKESWEYKVLLAWIQQRVPGVSPFKKGYDIDKFVATPATISLQPNSDKKAIHVNAQWNYGLQEDVTSFCRFQSKDESIATVSQDGVVEVHRPGSTQILVYYDRAITAVEVVSPFEDSNQPPIELQGLSGIDQAIGSKLQLLGLQPAPVCSDEEFLRRVSLDLTGTLPTPKACKAFKQSKIANKREQLIDSLLDSDSHSAYWTSWLCDLAGCNESVMPEATFKSLQCKQWYAWIHSRVEKNVPYNEIAEGMVAAVSRDPTQTYTDYIEEATELARTQDLERFAERHSMPYFWARTNLRRPEDKALAFSYVFLGVKLQCAECHKHPFDRWKKSDFEGVKAFFEPLKYGVSTSDRPAYERLQREVSGTKEAPNAAQLQKALANNTPLPWQELYFEDKSIQDLQLLKPSERAKRRNTGALDILVEWLRDESHPYLATAYVNRVWAHYFGRGMIDPQDDLSLASPPSNRSLLDYLVQGFIDHQYDMRWLHREIVMSQAYQRSWRSPDMRREEIASFARADLRRLPAEVLYDAIQMATSSDQASQNLLSNPETRMIGVASLLSSGNRPEKFLQTFGKPALEGICTRTRTAEPTLMQGLEIANSPMIHDLLGRPSGWVKEKLNAIQAINEGTARNQSIVDAIQDAYLRTLSREPTQDELEWCRATCLEAENLEKGLQDVLWSLLNTKEFQLNH